MFFIIILSPLVCALPCAFSQRWWRFWLFLGLGVSSLASILWSTLLHPRVHLCTDTLFIFRFSEANTVYLLTAGILGIGLILNVWFTRYEAQHMPRFAAFNMVGYTLALATLFCGNVAYFFVLSMLLSLGLAVGTLQWGRPGHAFIAMEWIVYKMIAYTLLWLGLSSVAANNSVFVRDLMRLSPLLEPNNFGAGCLWGALAMELGAFPFLSKTLRTLTTAPTSLSLLHIILLPLTTVVVLQRTIQLAPPTWWTKIAFYWLAAHTVAALLLCVKTKNVREKILLLGALLPAAWLFFGNSIISAYLWLSVSVCVATGLLFWKKTTTNL